MNNIDFRVPLTTDNIFDIKISDKIEITSKFNFNRNLDVIVYHSSNNELFELYRTKFPFSKDAIHWIGITHPLDDIIVHILDSNNIIYEYNNIKVKEIPPDILISKSIPDIRENIKIIPKILEIKTEPEDIRTDPDSVLDDFAYVTCGDLYYMDIIEKLVISLLNVSSRKIIVYGINCKVTFDYPNLIKRELNLPIKCEHDKWFWKQRACIESLKENFNNFVWMDGDIIANINIESISKYFSEIENYPLGEIHVQDEQIVYHGNESEMMGEKISKYFGINRKILKKDLHACFFAYNSKCEWFFEEILSLYHSIYDQGLYNELLGWNDESLHNFMHSKYGFTKTLPLSNLALLCEHTKYESNPKVLRLFYGYWNEDSPNNFGEVFGWSYVPVDKNQILYFHENKNLKDANEMIEFIKMKKNGSFNSSKWFFIDKFKIQNFELNRVNTANYDECKVFEHREAVSANPNDVVMDIGAGIGFFERYSYLKNASKIICFEPDEQKFNLLKLNSHENTILFNADVTNEVGSYIIETDIKDININTYSINYLFDAGLINKIDFLKIDNKGHEFEILNSINETNYRRINKISIKYYHYHYNNDNDLRLNFINNIMKHGYNSWNHMVGEISYIYFWKFNEELYRWHINNGDEILLYEHNLNEKSIVFDGGGYIGDWAKKYLISIIVECIYLNL